MEALLSTKDVCLALGLSADRVKALARSGELPAAMILASGQRLFAKATVARLARSRRRLAKDHQKRPLAFESRAGVMSRVREATDGGRRR